MSYRLGSRNNNETSLEMAARSSALPCSGFLCRTNTPLTGHMQGFYFQQLLCQFWCVSGKQQVSICAAPLFGCYLHKKFPTCPSASQEMEKLTLSSHQEAPRSIFQQLAQKKSFTITEEASEMLPWTNTSCLTNAGETGSFHPAFGVS